MTDVSIPSEAAILRVLYEAMLVVIPQSDLNTANIGPETRFVEDLALEFADIVEIVCVLRDHYGEAIDFPNWFATHDKVEVAGLTVGAIVHDVQDCLYLRDGLR